MRRLVRIIGIFSLIFAMALPMCVSAAGWTGWVKVSGEETWTYSDGQGTELVAKIQGDTLYIQGTGAIPSYSREALGSRPWHNRTIVTLDIADGITDIGAEAFSNMEYLHHVSMPVSAFIEDKSAFAGATDGCIFQFRGMNLTSRDIGKIPYNSLDNLAAFMQSYNGKYQYRLANYYLTTMVQNKVSPRISDLVTMDLKTQATNPKYPLINYSSSISMVSKKPDDTMKVSISYRQQGKVALEIFDLCLGDNSYVAPYLITVNNADGVVKNTQEALTYQMTVPAAYQFQGREFTLIQLGNGVVNYMKDEDQDDSTVTFTTDYPSSVCALVYKDTFLLEE